nr:uncharacterized protein LOC112785962 [Arachis hypogaea]
MGQTELLPSPFSLRPSPFAVRAPPFAFALRRPSSSLRPSPFAVRAPPFALRPSPFALRPSPVALRPSPFAFAFVTDGNHFFFILVIFIPFFSFLFFFESVRISLFTFKLQQTWATASSSLFFSSKPSNSIDALLAMLWTYVVFFWNEKATKHGTLGALVQDSVKSHYETLFYCFPFPSPAPILCFPVTSNNNTEAIEREEEQV